MRQKLIIANWKMNGDKTLFNSLLNDFTANISNLKTVVVCPPFIYIPLVEQRLAGSIMSLGAQDVSAYSEGAYTGEVAISMLQEFNCSYVIVGHSERRSYHNETDQLVADKFKLVLDSGLTPVLCVGETLEEHNKGQTEAVVLRQLNAVIDTVGIKAFSSAVIAYEPVWAIGTGKTATPEQAQQIHTFIRGKIAEQNEIVAAQLKILYGGSVNSTNAKQLFAMPDIDGGLVGGASLNSKEFSEICNSAG